MTSDCPMQHLWNCPLTELIAGVGGGSTVVEPVSLGDTEGYV